MRIDPVLPARKGELFVALRFDPTQQVASQRLISSLIAFVEKNMLGTNSSFATGAGEIDVCFHVPSLKRCGHAIANFVGQKYPNLNCTVSKAPTVDQLLRQSGHLSALKNLRALRKQERASEKQPPVRGQA